MHAEKLAVSAGQVLGKCHVLLALEVVALDRVVVHGHEEQAALLSDLQDVCVVDRVRHQFMVRQRVDKQLLVQRNEEVFRLRLPLQRMVIIEADACELDSGVLL